MPSCPIHGTGLLCPTCVALAQRGRPVSDRKRESARANAAKARAARWPPRNGMMPADASSPDPMPAPEPEPSAD